MEPCHSQHPQDIPADRLLVLFRSMVLIRKVELKIEELYHQDEMKTPVHLSLGEEAAAAGVCAHLRREDYVFSNHRSHAHYLAKGGDLKAMIAELYCRQTGCARGRGGSMHLIDTRVNFPGSSAIVGGSIPHAVGAALAAKLTGKDFIAVSFFGDAASEQGVFFESMSLAALKRLPVVFVCENNSYSVCSHIQARQPNTDVGMRPRAFDIPARRVDGMDVFAVHAAAGWAVGQARAGGGPVLLECCLQRWRGHAGAGDPLKEKYRLAPDLAPDWQRDPLAEMEQVLVRECGMTREQLDGIHREIDDNVEQAFRYARESPLPDGKDLEKYLYS